MIRWRAVPQHNFVVDLCSEIKIQTQVTDINPQKLYKAEICPHSCLDGAVSADKSLTACAIQLYPGYASGAKITAAV